MIQFAILSFLALLSFPSIGKAQSCAGDGLSVQILGSGGPRVNPQRASSSYLLWVDGQARIMVDMGGGTFLRFGQSQAKLNDLFLIAVSHLHPDHVSDLPALLWLSHQARKDPLPAVGPSGNEVAPSFSTFLSRLFDEKTGAFQVLGPTVGGAQGKTGGGVRLDASVVDVAKTEPTTVFERDGVIVSALGIPHGDMPTLAYRVQARNMSIVFSSDQTGTNPRFVDFAKGANLMIMHLNIAAGTKSPLHASPTVVGRVAQEAAVGRLILSHISQFDVDAAIADVKKSYTGALTIGEDLQCTSVR
jgi:ribonuclease BN (tRNA processing enzyme)